jgi:hypothetical protein
MVQYRTPHLAFFDEGDSLLSNRLAFGAFFFEEVKGPVDHDGLMMGIFNINKYIKVNKILLKAQKM